MKKQINKKKTICLDLDNTLVDTCSAIIELLNDKYNLGLNIGEIDISKVQWDFKNICGSLTKEQIDNSFTNEDLFKVYMPKYISKDTIDSLNKLKQLEFNLKIITIHNQKSEHLKREFINKYFPMVDEVQIITFNQANGIKFDKGSAIASEDFMLIDDRTDCLESCKVKHKLLFGCYDWNKDNNDNFFKIGKLSDIFYYLDTVEEV